MLHSVKMAEALQWVPTTQQQQQQQKNLFGAQQYPGKRTSRILKRCRTQYQEFISGNDLLSVASVLERVATRTVPLLTADVKTRKLVGVSREIMWSP